MWIAGASNGINGEARSSRWSNNGDWQKPGMKIVWRLTGDERPPKKWMPSGTNSALLLHFGLFLDQGKKEHERLCPRLFRCVGRLSKMWRR
jgi:hypothetical protein